MRKLFQFSFLLLLGLILGCSSTSKTNYNAAKKEALDTMVAERTFEIVSRSALPLATNSLNSISNAGLLPLGSTGNRVDLTTTPNYLRIIGDSLDVFLPYFGERQMGGGYNNTNVGITFKGLPKKFEITQNEKTQGYTMSFVIKNQGESYTVTTELFPNHNSSINVISTHRTPIGYNGRVSEYSVNE